MMQYIALIGLLGSLVPLSAANSEPQNLAPAQEAHYELVNGGTAVVVQNRILKNDSGARLAYRQTGKANYFYPVTGYSSTPEETDDTPFITASGNYVRTGTAAANWLPIGTVIRIPEIFGEQVFIVEDRMHERNNYKVDIWFPDKPSAKNFGVKFTKIEVL